MTCPVNDEPTQEVWRTLPWTKQLAVAYDTPQALLKAVGLSAEHFHTTQAQQAFRTRVPHSFVARMRMRDAEDPLLKQVLALDSEMAPQAGYFQDPLQEQGASNPVPGILHKYHGRVLLMLSGACAVNCRYCFRRHFPYAEQRLSPEAFQRVLDFLQNDPSIKEVILSGGDPLMMKDGPLFEVIQALSDISHLERLRIHTRLPVVLPARVTRELVQGLTETRLKSVMVLHINHPQECDQTLFDAVRMLKEAGVTLLNQSVLLKGINDSVEVLVALSEALFEIGVLPYYLHVLDAVQGAQEFEVPAAEMEALFAGLQARLPGYLVPKLAREVPGVPHKVLWHGKMPGA